MYLFIINQQSGKGSKTWKKTLPLVEKMDIQYKVYFITKEHQEAQLEKIISSFSIKAIIIVGGDGTLHQLLKHLHNRFIPIGIIPAGSGNDFARALKISKNCKIALKNIIDGTPKQIDLIYVNNKPAATIVGIGFDAKVAEITNRSKMKQWLNSLKLGTFAYVLAMFRAILNFQPTDLIVTIDGETKKYRDVWLIAVANTAYYGGGLKICPTAIGTDGLLNICVAHSLSKIELLLFFPLVFLGKHIHHRSVDTFICSKIEISGSLPLLVQADGEIINKTPVSIEVFKEQLQVIV